MIFYRRNNAPISIQNHWMPILDYTPDTKAFKAFVFKINDKEYFEDSEEFRHALKKDKFWDKLLYETTI